MNDRMEPAPIPLDTYHAVRAFFAVWYGEHGPYFIWNPHVDEEYASFGLDREGGYPVLDGEQATRMARETVQAYLDAGDADEGWGRQYADDWDDDGSDVFSGVEDVLDNALYTADHMQAARNITAVMPIADAALEDIDDSMGYAGERIDELCGKVRLFFERVARDSSIDAAICRDIVDPIMRICADGGRWSYDEHQDMLGGLLSLSRRAWVREVADEWLDRLETITDRSSTWYWSSFVLRLRHDDMLLAQEYDRARRFSVGHLEDDAMAMLTVAWMMLHNEPAEAGEAVRRHLSMGRDRRGADNGFMCHDLPDTTFPHGWLTVLVALAQCLGDRRELERLYTDIIVHNGSVGHPVGVVDADDAAYVDHLRSLVGSRRWNDQVRAAVLHACEETGRENRALEHLLVSDGLSGLILEYCTRHTGAVDGERAIDRLYGAICDPYPAESTALLLSPYEDDHAFVGTVPRAEYRRAADRFRRAVTVMGRDWVRERARKLVARYPRRANLKLALKELL